MFIRISVRRGTCLHRRLLVSRGFASPVFRGGRCLCRGFGTEVRFSCIVTWRMCRLGCTCSCALSDNLVLYYIVLSNTGMISTQEAPPLITTPENLPLRYKGVTQLSPNSTFSTLNFLNSILTMTSKILLSVNTCYNIMTVLFKHELFI